MMRRRLKRSAITPEIGPKKKLGTKRATSNSPTSPPALAQFAGDRAELLPALSLATSLRESLADWWLTNQLWISWSLLVLPLAFELIFGTFLLPYLILAPLSLLATYLIYRNSRV